MDDALVRYAEIGREEEEEEEAKTRDGKKHAGWTELVESARTMQIHGLILIWWALQQMVDGR